MAKTLERPADIPVDRLLDRHEVTAYLGWSVRKTEMLLASGDIPSVRCGRHRKVRASDLAAYISSLPAA